MVIAVTSCSDDDKVTKPDQLAYDLEVAERFAPLLVFDKKQGEESHWCFPMDAGWYYEVRKTFPYTNNCEPDCIIENMDYVSVFLGEIPTYYQYAECDEGEYVIYWWFYGYQPDCDFGAGEHPADWERIAVKIVDGELDRVLYFQHGGQYTKLTDSPDLQRLYGGHPVVFVGATAHGSYHNVGGPGEGTGGSPCCYWRDYRAPGPFAEWKQMLTWENLVRLSLDEDSPEWMRCEGYGCWSYCCPGPLMRGLDLCKMPACVGTDPLCGDEQGDDQQGCFRSDVTEGTF
jgi:hypothetical protein